MQHLDEAEWHRRRDAHRSRVEPWVRPRRDRRASATLHPVDDFLFEYYSYRTSHLMRWHPGVGVGLLGDSASSYLQHRGYRRTADGIVLDVASYTHRLTSVRRIHELLKQTLKRPARFGCFGLHEWAMVYHLDQDRVRHPAWPLRLAPNEVADVVDGLGLRCTHFDAVRFFTPPARPLNLVDVSRDSQTQHEQPGCLHANMDLYKWAYKLSPMTSSALVADAFELAREIRTVDMQASPYDLSALGYPPIRVETPEGRMEYVTAQQSFSRRAQAMRSQLLAVTASIIDSMSDRIASSGTPQRAQPVARRRTTPRDRHEPRSPQDLPADAST